MQRGKRKFHLTGIRKDNECPCVYASDFLSSRDRTLVFFFSSFVYREVADACIQWLESDLFSFFCCEAHCSISNTQFCTEAKV